MNLSSTQLRLLGSVMYFAAFALIVNVLADFTIKIWPMKLSELNWRVGAGGLLMDVMLLIVVPQALIYFAAFMNGDRKTLQILRWVTVALGVLTLGLLALFALDSVQITAQLPQNLKINFYKVALKAALIGLLSAALYIWFGLTVGKVLKSQGTVRTGSKEASDGMLMVGSREPARPALRSIDTKEPPRKEAAPGLSIDA